MLKNYGENGENQSQIKSQRPEVIRVLTNLRNVQLVSFFRLYFCCLLDQDLKGRKIGKFFAGFFHISKRRKTAPQLNRTETLKPGKKMLKSSYLRTVVRK